MRRWQSGLSLIELMLALAVGSIITVSLVQLFGASSDTWKVMAGQSRMQESARFALDFISRDLRGAGYRGCFAGSRLPDSLPYAFDLRFGVQGYDASGPGVWSPDPGDLPDGFDADAPVAGTDILTLRSLAPPGSGARLAVAMPAAAESIQVAPPMGGELGFDEADLALVHDCEQAVVVRVTAIDHTANAPNITLTYTVTDDWRGSFGTDALVSGIDTRIYFIAPGAGRNAGGDRPLSLWRKSARPAPVELVEGIEDLQFLFGVATDADSTPNQYLPAGQVANWRRVTAVRITLVANTLDDVGGARAPTHTCGPPDCDEPTGADGLMRRSFTQTVALRNGR